LTDVVEESFRCLRRLHAQDFFRRELPTDAIASIERLVDVFANSNPAERQRITLGVERSFAFVFPAYARRAAVESVRTNDPGLLKRGLIGLAIENATVDLRDTLPFVAFLYNSALKLNLNATDLLRGVGQDACPRFRRVVEGFLERDEASRSVNSFHYMESGKGAAFTYLYSEPPFIRPSKVGWRIRMFLLHLRRSLRS